MSSLCALGQTLGLDEPRTLLQTGNLVFGAGAIPAAELERRIEKASAEQLGLWSEVMARDADMWRALVAANPF